MPGLTAIQVKNAKPGRHADGRGLYLLVRDSGSRSWVLRTQVGGKRQDVGLGPTTRLSLAQARVKASDLRERIKSGENVRREPVIPVPKPNALTFAEAARHCHESLKEGWRNKRHRDSWLTSLETHIFPKIGETAIDEVTSAAVRDALAPIWLTIPETARRILQRIRTVLDYAHIEGWRAEETSLRSVPKGLPRQPAEENHFVAMHYRDVPALFARLVSLPPTAGRDALMFTILNASRSGEARLSVWPEFDLTGAKWSIPGSRMKMRQPHFVPLAPPSIEILKRRWPLQADDKKWVFSTRGTKPLSDMTLTKVLRDLGYEKITVHGFRSSFTDWAAERTKFPKEVVDKALAHKLQDEVEAAYRRTDFFDKRQRLMEAWAQFVWGTKKRSGRRS